MTKHPLQCIYPESNSKINISVNLFVHSDELHIHFDVCNHFPMNINQRLPLDQSNWGLWEHDVVESFISITDPNNQNSEHYFEFQMSPLGQFFELEIYKPRIDVNREYRSGSVFESKLQGSTWLADFKIPLQALGYRNGLEIVGNFFACLGMDGSRTYWSAFLPKQENPDFHLPQYFRKLI